MSSAEGSTGTILYVADGSSRVPKERLEAFSGDRTVILDDYRSLELLRARQRQAVSGKRQDKGHEAEVADFLRAIREGPLPIPLAELANVSLATLAVVESLRTARPVRIASQL